MEELKTLLPGKAYTLSNSEQIIIKPVPFGKLRIFSESIAELLKKLTGSGLKLESIEDWKVIFDVAFEEILKIMTLVLDKPREYFDSITISDGIGILKVIVEQNFSEEVKKNLKALIVKVRGLLQTQSSS